MHGQTKNLHVLLMGMVQVIYCDCCANGVDCCIEMRILRVLLAVTMESLESRVAVKENLVQSHGVGGLGGGVKLSRWNKMQCCKELFSRKYGMTSICGWLQISPQVL